MNDDYTMRQEGTRYIIRHVSSGEDVFAGTDKAEALSILGRSNAAGREQETAELRQAIWQAVGLVVRMSVANDLEVYNAEIQRLSDILCPYSPEPLEAGEFPSSVSISARINAIIMGGN